MCLPYEHELVLCVTKMYSILDILRYLNELDQFIIKPQLLFVQKITEEKTISARRSVGIRFIDLMRNCVYVNVVLLFIGFVTPY